MRWNHVCVEAIGYELPEERVSTASIEARLGPLYRALHLEPGHVAALTGIRERRIWPADVSMARSGARAAMKALGLAGLVGSDLGAVVYAGVCRDNLEPATACAIADALGASGDVLVFDVSNACLGVLNGMVEIANRIELRQMRAGVVVAGESSRAIVDASVARMNADPTMDRYRLGLATMTGGSGAVAVILTHSDASYTERHLVAGAAVAAPEYHRICRWGPDHGLLGETANVMDTDASQVLEHGVALGVRTIPRSHGLAFGRCRQSHLPSGGFGPSRGGPPHARDRAREGLLDVRNAREHGYGVGAPHDRPRCGGRLSPKWTAGSPAGYR